jgi:hypothetical protein
MPPPEYLCDHQFVTRSYYRRVRPGLFRRHVRWYLRCVQCQAVIGKGPVPSKPRRRTLTELRSQRRYDRAYRNDLKLLAADVKKSGKSLDQYTEELFNLLYGDDDAPA